MGVLDAAKAEGLESSDLGIVWGRRMRVYVPKIGATSRRSQGFICQRRHIEIQRRDVPRSL